MALRVIAIMIVVVIVSVPHLEILLNYIVVACSMGTVAERGGSLSFHLEDGKWGRERGQASKYLIGLFFVLHCIALHCIAYRCPELDAIRDPAGCEHRQRGM